MAPGIEVASAAHRPGGMRGTAEQFGTIGGANTTALIRNLLSSSRFHAAVHVRRGAGPDDPPVQIHPHPDDGEVPETLRPVLSYKTSGHATDGDVPWSTVDRV